MLSVVKLMRWLDSMPTPSSMQSRKGMWNINTVGLATTDSWQGLFASNYGKFHAGVQLVIGTTVSMRMYLGGMVVGRCREIFRSGICPAAPAPPSQVRHPHEQQFAEGRRDPISHVDELRALLQCGLGVLMPYVDAGSLSA
jgi:hypothetical protein